MEPRDIMVLSPLGADPALAIAASRGGAIGVLDLEFALRWDAIAGAYSRLSRFAGNNFGVQLRTDADELFSGILASPTKPTRVILVGESPKLAARVSELKAAKIEVFASVVSHLEAIHAAELGVDGLIVKGHEAGGRVGADTSFVLIQQWRHHADKNKLKVPFWVQGGIGANTAAACLAAGARGVVLDSQVLLARESPLSDAARKRIAGLDGSETAILGAKLGEPYRIYSRPDSVAAAELAKDEDLLLTLEQPAEAKRAAWQAAVNSRVSSDPGEGLWLVGQDIVAAQSLAAAGVTVSGIVQTICDRAAKQLEASRKLGHIAEGSAFAKSHGIKYPILQGPMTRVSDTAAFADSVATGGALPFLALALLRKAETEKLLADTKTKLGKKPWGVGILGFVPNEIRSEQMEAIRLHKPPFAIIAGGRPDQAKELETQGIPTYLHVPSPGLLKMFLKDGARRFIFEGQECGGHIGPRASFSLWESMVGVLAEHVAAKPTEELHVVFAGGIHDALSASMVAALSAGLAEKGVKVGVLIGTAYLFTKEAVAGGAITERFQKEALACGETVLLETGPGHAIRCIPTPYADTFEAEKRRLRSEGKSHLEVGIALERMNLGRLRIASKGVDRVSGQGDKGTRRQGEKTADGLVEVSGDDQFSRGMYMIGQIAALRDKVTTIVELHADVCVPAVAETPRLAASPVRPEAPPPCDVAIIGLSCFYPGSTGLSQYWENILNKVNAVIEIPPTHWDWRPFYDPDPRARDKMISKWGGFMSDIMFDPLSFGITPKSIPNIEPLQLLLLEAVRQAIADAGYANRPFERERTCAILGVGGGGMPLSVAYGFRTCMPLMDSIPGVPIKAKQIIELGEGILPEWTEDSFPGILLNVAAGRVSNRFNLGGPNMAIDAACGSSLAALYAGVRELNDGTSDVAIVMGGDAVQTPYAYVAFSKTYALSPRGRCRPFDAGADGIALAEGVGVTVLKRLADAERDGDRIYGVIKGIGASSDGRDKGLTAPRAEGQLRALHRAYDQARVSPKNVALVEAHGTGTVVGDQTEAKAIGQLFREAGGQPQSCALGSVKSMIGHSKCAAGLAGLIKTTFALYHKVLPPTLVETPNPKANLDGGPLYLNTEPRPWVHGAEHPRTAGVSAFGFGGTNFHTVLEEYTGDFLDRTNTGFRQWPAELFVWRRADVATITADVKKCRDALLAGASPELPDLAASVWQSSKLGDGKPTLAVVATSLADLSEKLGVALEKLATISAQPNVLTSPLVGEVAAKQRVGGKADGGVKASPPTRLEDSPPSPTRGEGKDGFSDPRGIYFAAKPQVGKVAFLFPGQGSQYPDMLAQTAMAFPEVRGVLDRAERTLAKDLDKPLGRFVYPPSSFSPEHEAANRKELQRTEVAQPALGATSLGMFKLLTTLGVEADFFAGHSYGEYAALAAAGALSEEDLIRLSYRRGKVIRDAAASAAGGMIAVDGTPQVIEPVLKGVAGVWVANHNSPTQTVLAGTEDGLKAATAKLQAANLRAQRIPVACGFHSPLISGAKAPLAAALKEAKFATPRKPVFSNTTGTPHGADPAAFATQLAEHLVSPVKFADEITAMYAAGARVFVEVGPQAVLTGLTTQTLAGKPHLAIASDVKARPGLVQLAHMLGQLLVAGVPVRLDRLFQGRNVQAFEIAKLGPDTGKPKLAPTTWVVNGVRSRPLNGPEPRLLGQDLSGTTAAKPAAAAPTPAAKAPTPPPAAAPTKPTAKPAVAATPPEPKPVPRPVHSSPAPSSNPPVVPGITRPMSTPAPMPTVSASLNNGTHTQPAPDGAAAVMMRFQEVMARFLDTQRSVMLGYLGGSNDVPASSGHVTYPLNGNGTNGHSNGNGNGISYSNGNGHTNGNGHAAPAVTNRIAPTTPVARPVTPPVAAPAPVATPAPAPATNGHVVAVAQPATNGNGKHTSELAKAVAPAAAKLDRDTLLARLLDLVSERTGYPKEALSIDLDLEADLGVDSIKRVEILGTLAESIGPGDGGKQPNLEMEKLSVIKTLRAIADYVMEVIEDKGETETESEEAAPAPSLNGSHAKVLTVTPERNGDMHPGARQGEVQRLVVRLIDAPLPVRPRFAQPTGTILLTDDGRGTARELADRLAELDVKTAMIQMANGTPAPEGVFAADLTDPTAVTEMLGRIHTTCGEVSGLIHLLPLAVPAESETDEQRMRREVKSLYLLSRGLENEIRAAGKAGSAVLLAVTAMGGQMGFGENLPADFFAGHGGVAGFTKCLGYEWPEVTVRVVDVDGETPATHLAEDLLAELGDPKGAFEVGRAGDCRVTWQVEPGPIVKDAQAVEIGPDSTVLITGGARGITAKVALELATRYKSKLVLVGSSPVPAEETADTAGLTSQAEIKAALLKRLPDVKPAAIEAAYRRLLKDREIRGNLDAIRKAGSTVDYRAVDVRDAAAFGGLLDELKAAGGIAGVIHGAGVIEDKLLRDKTPESFDKVFGTKVDSAMTLARHLDPEKLKFLAVYASITSRYGNRGQSDYAAANEVLSKLACDLDRRWPGRVVSMAWGPWSEVGMVADLEKHLVARGLKLIEPSVGAGFAVDEVIFGAKGEPEVLIAGGTEHARPGTPVATAAEPVAVGAQ